MLCPIAHFRMTDTCILRLRLSPVSLSVSVRTQGPRYLKSLTDRALNKSRRAPASPKPRSMPLKHHSPMLLPLVRIQQSVTAALSPYLALHRQPWSAWPRNPRRSPTPGRDRSSARIPSAAVQYSRCVGVESSGFRVASHCVRNNGGVGQSGHDCSPHRCALEFVRSSPTPRYYTPRFQKLPLRQVPCREGICASLPCANTIIASSFTDG